MHVHITVMLTRANYHEKIDFMWPTQKGENETG
jgi:hypothetical protein